MKSLKIVLASLFLVAGTIAVSSFTVKEFKSNAFAVKCYEYTLTTTQDNLDPLVPSTFVPVGPFSTQGNWTVSTSNPATVCPGAIQICRVCFDDSFITGTRTFADILTALHQEISISGLPLNGQTYNITVEGALIQFQVYLEPNS